MLAGETSWWKLPVDFMFLFWGKFYLRADVGSQLQDIVSDITTLQIILEYSLVTTQCPVSAVPQNSEPSRPLVCTWPYPSRRVFPVHQYEGRQEGPLDGYLENWLVDVRWMRESRVTFVKVLVAPLWRKATA